MTALLPVLDTEILEDIKKTMASKFDEIVNYYLEDAGEYVFSIKEGYDDNSAAAIIHPAHTLKSSSSQMGAMKLSEIARKIEETSRESKEDGSSIDSIKELVLSLPDELAAVNDAMKAFTKEQGE